MSRSKFDVNNTISNYRCYTEKYTAEEMVLVHYEIGMAFLLNMMSLILYRDVYISL